jgi:6-phosphogluconolactonase
LYELLASDLFRPRIEWSKVFFFFGDERNVPHDHPDSNFLMIQKALFKPLKISDQQIFSIDTSLPPAEAAKAYEDAIIKYFKGQPCRFDLVLLGLGDNSHTASLFPHTSVLNEKSLLVAGLYIAEVKMYRITFTAPLINQAVHIAFLVYGIGKAEAVRHILKEPLNIEEFPAQLIRPDHGDVTWFLDEAAASRIKN